MDKLLGRKTRPEPLKPGDCLARYLCIKASWRGRYRRIFCITSTCVITLNPEAKGLAVTNTYHYAEDTDIDSITVGSDAEEFTISARQDKKSKYKPIKFSCKHRTQLLTVLYQCIEAGYALGKCVIATKILGSPDNFSCFRFTGQSWKAVTLRITPHGVSCYEQGSQEAEWHADIGHLASPAVIVLAPSSSSPAPGSSIFAIMERSGQQPMVFSCSNRDQLLGTMQNLPKKKLGHSITMDGSAQCTPEQLAAATAQGSCAEAFIQQYRSAVAGHVSAMLHVLPGSLSWIASAIAQQAALLSNPGRLLQASEGQAGVVSDLPVGQWEVERLEARHDLLPPQVLQASPALSLRRPYSSQLMEASPALAVAGGANTVTRRLVLTSSLLLERRIDSYDVVSSRPLGKVAALVRFVDDPKLMAVEWSDGSRPTLFTSVARDAILAALLDAAQVASSRPIPVLPGLTHPGDVLVGSQAVAYHCSQVDSDPLADVAYLEEINSRGKELAPLLLMHYYQVAEAHLSSNAWSQGQKDLQSQLDEQDAGDDAASVSSQSGSLQPGSATAASAAAGAQKLATSFMDVARETAKAARAAAHNYSSSKLPRVGEPGHISAPEAADLMLEAVYEFNASVPYAGPACYKEVSEQALAAVVALLPEALMPNLATPLHISSDDTKQAVAVLQCLQRLAAQPLAAEGILSLPGAVARIFAALACSVDHIVFEAARLLTRLWSPAAGRRGAVPWKMLRASALGEEEVVNSIDDNTIAKAAKALCFTPALLQARCAALLAPLQRGSQCDPLSSLALVEAAASVVCDPGCRTTDTPLLNTLLEQLAALGQPLFALFGHPAGRVGDGAACIMRAIAECGAAAAAPMREASLREGAILQHLHRALYGPKAKAGLSRELVASWADQYAPAIALLRRVFPSGLVRTLNKPKAISITAGLLPISTSATAAPAAAPLTPTHATANGNEGYATLPAASAAASAASTATSTATSPRQHATSTAGTVSGPASPRGGGRPPLAPQAPAAAPAAAPSAQGAADAGRQAAARAMDLGVRGMSVGENQSSLGGPVGGGDGAAQSTPGVASPQQQPQQPRRPQYAEVTGGLKGNWEAFWAAALRDHCHAGLIWNESTRAELAQALSAEEQCLRARRQRVGQGGGAYPAWNYTEFSVDYGSLSHHLCLGGVYVRLLLEGADQGAVEKLVTPREFFNATYHHFLATASSELQLERWAAASCGAANADALQAQAQAEQELCVRAMAAVYNHHAAAIGPFDGVGHIAKVLDLTTSRSLRAAAFKLLAALVAPKVAVPKEADAARRCAAANGYALVDAGGIELLCDLVSSAHESTERRTLAPAATAGHLLTAMGHAEQPKEWYVYPNGYSQDKGKPSTTTTTTTTASSSEATADSSSKQDGAGDGASGGSAVAALLKTDETGRAGPLSKEEVLHLYSRGHVTLVTHCWAAGMAGPLPLWEVRELRWLMAKGSGGLTSYQAAALALQVLQSLARMQPAVDEGGHILQPLPRVHRLLATPRCLPHICQVMLTGEPPLVSAAASLLLEVLQHHEEALPRLYTTGVFFFCLAYCGSNLAEISRLLQVAHLKQQFRGPQDLLQAGAPLAARSYLGQMLPESLLYVIETRGAEAFASAISGDSDTPEVVWTHDMRGTRLVPALLQHLGDFPYRLAQNNHLVYEYTPLPPLTYPELATEMYCHRYYLRNLSDTTRFPDWPLVDHIPLLQALLAEWRRELSRKPLAMSEGEALQVLGIAPGPDGVVSEDELRRAYRSMARKYHPDKNPAGRPMFLQISKAYERLQAGVAGGQGPQPWRVLLMLRSQCVLFSRCGPQLAPFKYAGYPQLLEVVKQASAEGGSGPLAAEGLQQVLAAVELCWLTCVCSALNAEELMRCGGVTVLGQLLSRCKGVMPLDASPTSPEATILTHTLRTFAGLATVPAARQQLQQSPVLVKDVVLSCGLERAPAAVDAALLCMCYMSESQQLQAMLLEAGALGHVVPLLLRYDATLGPELLQEHVQPFTPAGPAPILQVLDTPSVRPNMQQARSYHALLATQALARLAGLLPPPNRTPKHDSAAACLRGALTESLAMRLGAEEPQELLKDLNSSLESAQVIWNSGMREELSELMAAQRAAVDLQALRDHSYSAIQDELQVCGVFIRLFNQRTSTAVSDPPAFCKGLVRLLYDLLITKCSSGADVSFLSPSQKANLLDMLTALGLLLEQEPRLLGLLTSRSALSPLLAALLPAACALAPPASPPQPPQPSEPLGDEAVAAAATGPAAAAAGGADLAFVDKLAVSSLGFLTKLTQHSGCVEAMVDEEMLRRLCWLLHAPSSYGCLAATLGLLRALLPQPQLAWVAGLQGGAVYLLEVILRPDGSWPWPGGSLSSKAVETEVRQEAAGILGRLMLQASHGPRVVLLLQKLLPPGQVDALQEGPPDAAVRCLDRVVETPECLWDMQMAAAAAAEVATLAATLRKQQAAGEPSFSLPPAYSFTYPRLAGELYVGGVYVRLFLKTPKYAIRNPKRFVEGLLDRYHQELQQQAQQQPGSATSGTAVLLSAAVVAALQAHPLLAAHVTQQGHLGKLLGHLGARVKRGLAGHEPTEVLTGSEPCPAPTPLAPDELGGTCLRLLHQLATHNAVQEALAMAQVVTPLVEAMRWGQGAAALVLETLQRALASSNSQRDLLVGQALRAGLLQRLLGLLDWRNGAQLVQGEESSGSDEDSQVAVLRAVAVAVLQAMLLEGAHSAQVEQLLAASEVWAAYRDQRHDLFLPSGASAASSVVGLLEAGGAARYALPAPETLNG